MPLLVSGGPVSADRTTEFGETACAHGSLGELLGPQILPEIVAMTKAGRFAWIGGGGNLTATTHIDNTVEGTLLAWTADGVAGDTFNLACGEATTLNQLLDHVREISAKDVEAVNEERQPGDLQRSQADISRAREALGYEPEVDIRAGLEKTFVHHTRKFKPAEDTEANYG